MPELPEVETIRRDLKKKIIGKKIIDIRVIQKKSIKNSHTHFIKNLKNNSIENISRKGKLLSFAIKENKSNLLIHLRMTGQLVYYITEKDVKKNTRVIFTFNDNSQLFFNDTRRFGYLQIVNEKEKDVAFAKMGIDILDKSFTFEKLQRLLKNKKRNLKSVLLDQKVIAGIGNIYADEICFDAKFRPDKNITKLNDKEIKKLYNSIIKTIKLAIKNRGTSFNDYVDSSGKKGNFSKLLKVYQKEKDHCQNCHKKSIKKIKVAGRATRYCGYCQK
ncbi:MAG: bifunctional DNA-formamidopyrimidine glycosylase/DNA-(apurinic or apyrimidinic site) lyase [Candidatus Pacebacteria bacterium]|nr:bifunctional DNA-formamidopyrimidine glycosylase/DNA-(apurinic or apyrimidinic site) lyase [Candidatus Paceibacterota bacterium]